MFRAGQILGRTIIVSAILLLAAAALSAEKKHPPDTPVDLNVANIKELEQLPGVGPTTAKAIIDFRTKSGRFRRVNDLLVIRGISEAKLKKMRPYVTVGPPPPAKSEPAANKPALAPKPAAPAKKPGTPAATSPVSPSSH
jgi:competence protein ComEA